ncbi:hypothetical protein [Blastopirellula retiformator]|uniref:Uncharacterized protein n=1 Tax=Blastopirellula retiformator TaxID=2527970 RepID=A0A5C5UY01_9BACT|nr:hypothetical protein [Blastopirellula retiformator]TWT30719.1 hypothetical protein Enr8_42420 [Blastopirellula retiformator]
MIDCDDCQQFVYDLEKGERATVAMGPDRVQTPQRRLPGMKLQCGQCPKKSPQNAKRLELSVKNWKTYQLWREVKATHGRCLTDEMARDSIIRRNLAILDALHEVHERNTQQNQSLQTLALLALNKAH